MNDLTKGTTMQNPEWVQENDWARVMRGDTVRLTNDDGAEAMIVVRDRRNTFHSKTSLPWVTSASGFAYMSNVWRLFVKAPARLVLPTVPGTVIRAKGHGISAMLGYVGGEWLFIGGARPLTDLELRENFKGGFDVLEPVSETAKKVLDRVRSLRVEAGEYDLSGISTRDMLLELIDALAVEFGVTS